jgi:hypothetical protein
MARVEGIAIGLQYGAFGGLIIAYLTQDVVAMVCALCLMVVIDLTRRWLARRVMVALEGADRARAALIMAPCVVCRDERARWTDRPEQQAWVCDYCCNRLEYDEGATPTKAHIDLARVREANNEEE